MKKARRSFLKTSALTCLMAATTLSTPNLVAAKEKLGWPEKEELTFGFIKLTDMAPIAIAYEKGFF